MSDVERVARAITVAEGDEPDGFTWSLLNEKEVWWQHRIPQARAAIEAMREPTDMVIEAVQVYLMRLGHQLSHNDAREAWHAGIDEALGQLKSEPSGIDDVKRPYQPISDALDDAITDELAHGPKGIMK